MTVTSVSRPNFNYRGYIEPAQLERLILETLVSSTIAAALAAAHARGRNNRKFADQLAVAAMQETLNRELLVPAIVLIGEGERDDSYWLADGSRLGPNPELPPQLFIAVDPLEATNNCARNEPGAITIIAAALQGEGSIIRGMRGVDGYMNKLVVGEDIANALAEIRRTGGAHGLEIHDTSGLLENDIEDVVRWIAYVRGKRVENIVSVVLERDRNTDLIRRLRRLNTQVQLIRDGDITAGYKALDPDHEVDIAIGIGAAAEGVITAAMTRVFRGHMEARWWFPEDELGKSMRARLIERGFNVNHLCEADDLASGHVMFSMTAVTDSLVPGIIYRDRGTAVSHSIFGRSRTGTIYGPHVGNHGCPPEPPTQWPGADD